MIDVLWLIVTSVAVRQIHPDSRAPNKSSDRNWKDLQALGKIRIQMLQDKRTAV